MFQEGPKYWEWDWERAWETVQERASVRAWGRVWKRQWGGQQYLEPSGDRSIDIVIEYKYYLCAEETDRTRKPWGWVGLVWPRQCCCSLLLQKFCSQVTCWRDHMVHGHGSGENSKRSLVEPLWKLWIFSGAFWRTRLTYGAYWRLKLRSWPCWGPAGPDEGKGWHMGSAGGWGQHLELIGGREQYLVAAGGQGCCWRLRVMSEATLGPWLIFGGFRRLCLKLHQHHDVLFQFSDSSSV